MSARQARITQADIDTVRPLLPFLRAARLGLARSTWRPGDSTDDLLAPIVLAVLVEVGRTIGPPLAGDSP